MFGKMWLFVDEGENADPFVGRDGDLKWKHFRTSAATLEFKDQKVRINNCRSETFKYHHSSQYRGDDKSLARPGRKNATATDDFDFHISYL